MHTLLLVVHVAVAAALIVLVLLQRGKGAEMGAAFGSGASSTVFGSQGSASFLTRVTAGLATTFFLTSLGLAFLAVNPEVPVSVTESVTSSAPAVTEGAAPAAPAPEVPEDVPVVPLEAPPAAEAAGNDVPAPPSSGETPPAEPGKPR
ncbi:MAG TPA: preprotein translocase subunit SecG [Gammaproteobacteria bacterium]|nr:preprotein translocase subunit SecG [Gammaproteobacteria bacterium]